MKELFLPYELALELKELGFDKPCFAQYGETEKGIGFEIWTDENYEEWRNEVKAPTFSQAFKFFRELKDDWGIESWIQPYLSPEPRKYESLYWRRGETKSIGVFDTYEEAELECIKALIKLVKEEQQ